MKMKEYVEIQRDMYRKQNMFGDLHKDAEIRMGDIFQWIIENGKTYIGNNHEMAKTVVKKSHRTPELKACYNNSLLVRSSMPGLVYYEGWSSLILPMNHAWNMLDDEVVDVTMTLPELEESEWHDNATREYFGVEIPWDWMFSQVKEETHFRPAGSGGPFLYDYAIKRIMEERQEV